MEIARVRKHGVKQMVVTIPYRSDIQVNDFVEIIKIEKGEDKKII